MVKKQQREPRGSPLCLGLEYLQNPSVDLDPADHPLWFQFTMLGVILCVFAVLGYAIMRWKVREREGRGGESIVSLVADW